jgi:hypothetical protein
MARVGFLTRTFECLRRKGLSGVVSFSDPVPRTKADGTIVHRGHVGTCYQATSATFLGRTEPRAIRLLPDGTVLNDRTIQKIRSGEQGGITQRRCSKRLEWNLCRAATARTG